MKRLILLALLLCLPAAARERFWSFCQQGATKAVVSGLSSTNTLMGSFPQCSVKVTINGSTTLANLYSDNLGTPLANPFVANSNGFFFFYADDGRYDVGLSGGGLPSPWTIGDIELNSPNQSTPSLVSFGCKGDGSTNDTACVQSAINSVEAAGIALTVDGGKNFCVGQLTITGPLTLSGPGSFKRCASLSNGVGIFDVTGNNVNLAGFTIDGQTTTPTQINYSNNPSPFDNNQTVNTSIWIHGGSSNITLGPGLTINHTGGYAGFIDARNGNINHVSVLGNSVTNSRSTIFGTTALGFTYGGWTGGFMWANDGNSYTIDDLLFEKNKMLRVTGNAIWGHAPAINLQNTNVRVINNYCEDAGLDCIQMENVNGGVVSHNYGKRIGYVAYNPSSPATDQPYGIPAWIATTPFSIPAVFLDTSALVTNVDYTDNSADAINGGWMDGDGYGQGTVRPGVGTSCWYSVDPHAQPTLCGVGGNGVNEAYGWNSGDSSGSPLADVFINVIGGEFNGFGGGAIKTYGCSSCKVSNAVINHPAQSNNPSYTISAPIAYGPFKIGPTTFHATNTEISNNTVYWSPPTGGAIVAEDSQYAAFVITDKNIVHNNTCISTLSGCYELFKDPSSSTTTGALHLSSVTPGACPSPSAMPYPNCIIDSVLQTEGTNANSYAANLYSDVAGTGSLIWTCNIIFGCSFQQPIVVPGLSDTGGLTLSGLTPGSGGTPLCIQGTTVYKGGCGGGGGGGSGSWYYTDTTGATVCGASMCKSIPAATHAQGTTPFAFCTNLAPSAGVYAAGSYYVPCLFQQSPSGAAGDLIVTWTSGDVGGIVVTGPNGGGGGGSVGPGTVNYLSKFTSTTNVGNSSLIDNGTTLTTTEPFTTSSNLSGLAYYVGATQIINSVPSIGNIVNIANSGTTTTTGLISGGSLSIAGGVTFSGLTTGTGGTTVCAGAGGVLFLGGCGGSGGGGGTYSLAALSAPQTVSAATLTANGVNPLVATAYCFSGALSGSVTTGHWVNCDWQKDASGNFTISWGGTTVQSIQFNSGGGGGGGGGGMVYPPAGVPLSTGTAWGSSYTVGTAANNLVQLDGSGRLPAVSGVNLTALPSNVVANNATNSGTSAMTLNLTASTVTNAFRVPVSAGLTATVNGTIGYDSTNDMLHVAQASGDAFAPLSTVTPGNGDCVNWVVSGGKYKLGTAGSSCGSSGGGSAFSAITTGTNTTASMVVGTGGALSTTGTGTIAATTVIGFAAGAGTLTGPASNLTLTASGGVMSNSTTGNAATATQLASSPAQCTNQWATGISTTGAANCSAITRLNGVLLSSLTTGLLKNTTGTGVPSIAASGTDYAPATTGTSILVGNGSGGFSAAAASDVALLGNLSNNTTGTANTAVAFLTTPTLCSTGQAPTGILANGNATGCAAIGGGGGVSSFNTRTGAITLLAADVNAVGGITNNTSGNAGTATALSGTITTCSSGSAPTGITAGGSSTGCTPYLSSTSSAGGYLSGHYPNPYIYSDIRNYGAVCNGTDQNTSVVSALASGLTAIYIPAGCTWVLPVANWTYNPGTGTRLVLANSVPGGINFTGENWQTSTIQVSSPTTTGMLVGPGTIISNMNIQHSGCAPQDYQTGSYQHGITCPMMFYANAGQQYKGTVNSTTGVGVTYVQWQTGDKFVYDGGYSMAWAGSTIVIGGTAYTVGSIVTSGTAGPYSCTNGSPPSTYYATCLTINTTSVGNLTGASYYFDTYQPPNGDGYQFLSMATRGPSDYNALQAGGFGGDTFYAGCNEPGCAAFRASNAGGTNFYSQRLSNGVGYYSVDNPGVTGGFAHRTESTSRTGGTMMSFYQSTTNWNGNVIDMDIASGSGSYIGKFININNNLSTQFSVDQAGNTFTNTIQVAHGYTVASLNSLMPCTSSIEGRIVGVTDIQSPVLNNTAVGGGGIHLPVYCNSAAWVIF